MTEAKEDTPLNPIKAGLPRRDWILQPFISLLTVALLTGSMSLTARRMFPEWNPSVFSCMVLNDSSTGERGIPNCVTKGKMSESQPVEYRFNSSGYRADIDFGPKTPGTYRIVMGGTSIALGLFVKREDTFAALLPEELSRQTGRRVELYNQAWAGVPRVFDLRFNQALANNPDLILWVLTPWDIQNASFLIPEPPPPPDRRSSLARAGSKIKAQFATQSFSSVLSNILKSGFETISPGSTNMLRHFVYQSQSQYVKGYLAADDEESGYLKAEPSMAWQSHLRQFDTYVADVEERARIAGVPLVTVLVPFRAQAAMASMGQWPVGYDPYKLDNELRTIITRHGGAYIDILPYYRDIPNPERGYFPVDPHLNADGHSIVSRLLAKELTSGAVPTLKVDSGQQTALEQGK